MSKILRLSALLAVLATGCTARPVTYGGGASGGRPPSLGGRAVPMFDHYCATLEGGVGREAAFVSLLDEASDQGWEMVGVSDGLVCFKRPRGDAAAPTPPTTTPPAETPPAETPPAPPPA